MTTVDRNRPEPLYYQLEQLLLQQILDGQWPQGTQIPTEDELCRQYGVSRVTAQQAVRNLVNAGHLIRERGRGTFVRLPNLTAGERHLRSFSQEMLDMNFKAGAEVISVTTTTAQAAAKYLGLSSIDPVIALRRLRTGNNLPIGIQTALLPLNRFPGLEDSVHTAQSLYSFLHQRYGVIPLSAEETFEARSIQEDDAQYLQIVPGSCGFFVTRITLDETGPFEYTTSVMRADRYRLQWKLTLGGS